MATDRAERCAGYQGLGTQKDASCSAGGLRRTGVMRADALGLGGPSPILAISSFGLPVAPFFRLTDLGLVDTLRQEFVPSALAAR